jgi:hypothetical protein
MRTPSRSIEMTTSPPFESFFSILTAGSRPPGGDGGEAAEAIRTATAASAAPGDDGDGCREPSATLPIV